MSTRRWKCVYNRRLFSFCLPESRRPSRRACRGHPDNHEHSDVIQQWDWGVAKEVDQPSLLPVEGLCRQCLCITETISFTCSQARLLTLRCAGDSTWLGFIIKPALLGHKWEEHWSCISRQRGLCANSPLKAPSMNSTETGWMQYIYMLTFTFTM